MLHVPLLPSALEHFPSVSPRLDDANWLGIQGCCQMGAAVVFSMEEAEDQRCVTFTPKPSLEGPSYSNPPVCTGSISWFL